MGDKNKKFAIIGVSSILLVAAVVGTITYGVSKKNGEDGGSQPLSTTSKAAHTMCQYTDYKDTCEKSLVKAQDNDDPNQLAQVAFQAAVDGVREVIANSSLLKEAATDPRTSKAFEICKEVLDDSIDDLQRSIEKINAFDKSNFDLFIDDLTTWLSGAGTFQETCLDAFENTTGDTGEKMKELMKTTTELTSNGLAIVTQLGKVLSGLQIPGFSRRLLEDGNGRRVMYDDYYPPDGHHTRRLHEDSNGRRVMYDDYYPPDGHHTRRFLEDGNGRRVMYDDYYPPDGHHTRRLLEDGNGRRVMYDDYYPPDSHRTRRLLEDDNGRRVMYDDYYPPDGHRTRRLLEDDNGRRVMYDDYYPPDGHRTRRLLEDDKGRRVMYDDYYPPDGHNTRRLLEDDNGRRVMYDDYYPPDGHHTRRLLEDGNGRRVMYDDYYPPDGHHTRRILEDGNGRRVMYDDYYPPDGHHTRRLLENGNDRRVMYDDYYPPDGHHTRRLLENGNDRRVMYDDYYPPDGLHTRRLLQADPRTLKPNVVVALDGSGQFKSIQAAINTAPQNVNQTFIILVKAGVYHEYVEIPKKVYNIYLIGEGPTNTRITGNKNYADGIGTFKTATVAVNGDNFIARDIGFENTAGAIKHQAVALRVSADRCIFYNCHIDGYQDSLYVHNHRQYYRDCTISGTIDFIFGDAAAVFQNCKLVVRKPLDNQACMVTAQGRKDPRGKGAIVIQNCTITAEEAFLATKPMPQAFLGRPWKEYSRTIVMQSFIDSIIVPEGWSPWAGTFALDTLSYAEYQNRGPGSNTASRIQWKGMKKLTPQQAMSFTPGAYIDGHDWIEGTSLPYQPGMIKV